jgi:hypothetical protein
MTVIRETAGLAAAGEAVFGPGRAHRYLLTRTWDPGRPVVTWVMLNPSTADAFTDDATIRRCRGFAIRESAGGIAVVNLFAYRATDPAGLRAAAGPVGELNDTYIRDACPPGRLVIAAWGAHSLAAGRGAAVAAMLAAAGVRLHCLGTTSHGHPRHPLYVKAAAPLVPFT